MLLCRLAYVATIIHSQLSKYARDLKMETPSMEAYILGILGLSYLSGAVDGVSSPMSSKLCYQLNLCLMGKELRLIKKVMFGEIVGVVNMGSKALVHMCGIAGGVGFDHTRMFPAKDTAARIEPGEDDGTKETEKVELGGH
ncbi:hypothetical protein Bca4012_027136 [Brassica carinata]